MRIGIIGLGKFGKYHLDKYRSLPDVEEILLCDPYVKEATYKEVKEIINGVDAASVTTPSVHHFDSAKCLLENDIHCLIEKPIATTNLHADFLVELATKNSLVLQVGHIERFNSEYLKLEEKIRYPFYVDMLRTCGYHDRCKDIDVVLDMMIHDIDILLTTVDSSIESIEAKGVSILSEDSPDAVYAQIRFTNKASASLTANRVTSYTIRHSVFYLGDKEVFLDFGLGSTDALMEEIKSFVDCVKTGKRPVVSGEDGRDSLRVALEISEQAKSERSYNIR